ncbi:hypothetical protein DUNSADRAFT_3398 [Dunaliella salina]|uniref:U2A'/phosphoprotein 32 family A C-terminal domain-containing protein n=1 Tax=Dunaliella salina TaxID=3046 RepID=A0ABQ7GU33_DUNSA|nr:hypothetical protein DUNSADRAFT_3398 [Dunaliella salina]|eukprot:KAF5838089.1 hypothetical protein DUNSADRAFT_3398 [Dunaliella salina]
MSSEEDAALLELLDANGLDWECLQTEGGVEQVTHLEMFLQEYPKMLGLHHFPFLRTLCFIRQEIKEIEGLERCVHLEKLWIVENDVTEIKGLNGLHKLRELFLYSNHITQIANLEELTNLEVLWLADNNIQSLEGLGTLGKLRELNMARNDIVCIGDCLNNNTSLEVLNLADNSIGSFKEVCALSHLPRLTELCFSDPMWGESPLAALCNYQTFVLFMLPKLSSLDTLVLADETKQLAEATFLKKQMYYNMRIKTVFRNARNIIRQANEGKKQKEIQRELEELEHYGKSAATPVGAEGLTKEDAEALHQKLFTINAKLAKFSQQFGEAGAYFEACCGRMHKMVEAHVSRMLLELDTAGNIRLEEGRPSDLWFASCVDLVNSRFQPNDYDSSLKVAGVSVLSVTRIHNRWLRNRFEKQAAEVGGSGDSTGKRSMEYLFLGEHPGLPGMMEEVVEAGLQPASEYAAKGLDAAIVVSNSLFLAEKLRLRAALAGGLKSEAPAVSRLLIVKAFLGQTAQDSHALSTDLSAGLSSLYNADGSVCPASCLEGPPVSQDRFSGAPNAVFRTKSGDTKQRLWYIFDHLLVLPEYLVEFQYSLSSPQSCLAAKPQLSSDNGSSPKSGYVSSLAEPLSPNLGHAVFSHLEPDLRPLARPLLSWLALRFEPEAMEGMCLEGVEEAEVKALLERQPLVGPRPKPGSMDPAALEKYLQGIPLGGLTYLNLHNSGLTKVESLGMLRSLKVLVLAFNSIQRLDGLSELTALVRLDLAHNQIKKVVPWESRTLSPEHEPPAGAGPTVLRKLKALTLFDGCPVSASEKAMFTENAGALSMATILQHGTSGQRFGITDTSLSASTSGQELAPAQITELVLERKHIRRLQNLSLLPNLRRASFADNQISHIESLEGCTALEELCLEENRVVAIEGLQGCTRLKKLQLGRNRLAYLDMLGSMTSLTQLSVEDNELKSLAGIEPLVNLMELYAGNNRLQEMREVQRLRELPKLIILDLSGNPCSTASPEDYRLYVIFSVRKLKVLDGAPIEAAEQASAKSKYSGRLTLEFLEERLGHRLFDRIRELDVSGLKVRDVGSVFLGPELGLLQELHLNSNLLVDISGLAMLKELQVLSLVGNRLGEECTFNPRRLLEKNPSLLKAVTSPDTGAAESLSSFQLFPRLQVLQLGSNQITNIASLQLNGLTSLRTLFLNNNDITRINGLDGLINLQELVLDRNRIRYVDPDAFSSLSKLRELRLEENGLRSLANLHHLTGLQVAIRMTNVDFSALGNAAASPFGAMGSVPSIPSGVSLAGFEGVGVGGPHSNPLAMGIGGIGYGTPSLADPALGREWRPGSNDQRRGQFALARGLKPTSMGTAAAADVSPGGGGLARVGGLSAVTLAPVARRPPLIHGGPRGGYGSQR